jgi:hypothetical protein
MLQPGFVEAAAQEGRSIATHAYANNNPLSKIDPDGRGTIYKDKTKCLFTWLRARYALQGVQG